MRSLEGRLSALEATGSSRMVCAGCRTAGSPSPCHHFGVFLSLVPRIEYASTEEWQCVRESGQQALERAGKGQG